MHRTTTRALTTIALLAARFRRSGSLVPERSVTIEIRAGLAPMKLTRFGSTLLVGAIAIMCGGCLPVVAGGLIYKSTKSNDARERFMSDFRTTNAEREAAGLAPLDWCTETQRFDRAWAEEDPNCAKRIEARETFMADLRQRNAERKETGLPALDWCSEAYQFDRAWAQQDPNCAARIKAYEQGDMSALDVRAPTERIPPS